MRTKIQLTLTAALLLSTTGFSQMKTLDTLMTQARQKLAVERRAQVFSAHATASGDTLTLRGEVYPESLHSRLVGLVRESWKGQIVDSLSVLPHPALAKKTLGVVSLSVANLRTHPDHGEEMATQVLLGMPLRILKSEAGWDLVQTMEDYLGWTDDKVVPMDREEFDRWSALPKVTVTAVYGFSYQEPNSQSQVVSDLVVGDVLSLKSVSGEFFEVGYPDGRTAFLRKEDAAPLQEWLRDRAATGESIVSTAKKFFGIPYLWGGTSSKALDCSGFVKTVYHLNGILLPRDADQQAAVGTPVDTSENFSHLRPGDLLFFGAKATATRRERITHVGISLGGMRYIHESGDVHLNSLDPGASDYSEFRRKGLLKVQRILGSEVRLLKDLPNYLSGGL